MHARYAPCLTMGNAYNLAEARRLSSAVLRHGQRQRESSTDACPRGHLRGGRATQGHAGWRAAVLSHVQDQRCLDEETGTEHDLSSTTAEGEGR